MTHLVKMKEKIATSVGDYMEDIDKIKKEVEDSNPADKTAYWTMIRKYLK